MGPTFVSHFDYNQRAHPDHIHGSRPNLEFGPNLFSHQDLPMAELDS